MIPILQMRKLRLREGQLPAQHHTVRLSLPGQQERMREKPSPGEIPVGLGGGGWIQMGSKKSFLIPPHHHSPSDVPSLPTFSLQMGDGWIVQS